MSSDVLDLTPKLRNKRFEDLASSSFRDIPDETREQFLARKAGYAMEVELRRVLEHLGIKGADDFSLDAANLIGRATLAGYPIRHVKVKKKPKMDGLWIFKAVSPTKDVPILIICNPIIRGNGSVAVRRMNP